jgi:hypothetical protein
MPTISTL